MLKTIPTAGTNGAAPTQRAVQETAEMRRRALYLSVPQNVPAEIDAEEIDAHFNGMPLRYWERTSQQELVWGLETIHQFLCLVAQPNSAAIAPVLDWKTSPDGRSTRVILCTWDRHGLLAKAAAAFSTVRINVLQADVFTRSDGIVLDVFRVSEGDQTPVVDPARMQKTLFLLEGALCDPPRFASFWACSGHRLVAGGNTPAPMITFDNASAPDHTLLRIETADRLGLLSDILGALADCSLNIDHAVIDTDDDLVQDVFYLRDRHGARIFDDARLGLIRKLLTDAIMI
jgi:[protein-PII] uridylyltransferase